MPLEPSAYHPPAYWRNGHLSTIYSALFRRVPNPGYRRERLELPDGDFLDLDWLGRNGENKAKHPGKIVVLVHGLEGDTRRPYMVGSAVAFAGEGYAVCAVNLRGCSGEPNRLFRSYHSGATEDLQAVVQHLTTAQPEARIYLKGFSLGGNLILKYLGEDPGRARSIQAAAAISVPVDLRDSLMQLQQPRNRLYSRRFLRNLREKMRQKHRLFPDRIPLETLRAIRTLKDFDDLYTSRAHGFRDALDYYARCSSLPVLENIRVPTLLLNARNDSFLGPTCYPGALSERHPRLFYESPAYGGHVGFILPGGTYYNELRAIRFFRQHS